MPHDTLYRKAEEHGRIERMLDPMDTGADRKRALKERVAAMLADPVLANRVRGRLRTVTPAGDLDADPLWARAALTESTDAINSTKDQGSVSE